MLSNVLVLYCTCDFKHIKLCETGLRLSFFFSKNPCVININFAFYI